MSILILRGPDAPPGGKRAPLSDSLHSHVIATLVDRAVRADKALCIRACGTDEAFIDALAGVARDRPDIVLVDPGAGIGNPRVCDALRRLRVPFVEIHDDVAAALEPELREAPATRIGVIHGYLSNGYVMAMAMALEHIGCADCESDIHVGT